jgi:hypothetical protein
MYHTGVDLATAFSMTFPKINAIGHGEQSRKRYMSKAEFVYQVLPTTSPLSTLRSTPESSGPRGAYTFTVTMTPLKLCFVVCREIIVQNVACCPTTYIVRTYADDKVEGSKQTDETRGQAYEGFGLYWEADAVARCLGREYYIFRAP